MVRAILAGQKTQTRRIAKPTDTGRVKSIGSPRNWHTEDPAATAACPYGQRGDRLWVKETWRTTRGLDHCKPTGLAEGAPIQYDADRWQPGFGLQEPGKTRVSLFMRRWMSRITLEIESVRVERLQAITEADAIAEGIRPVTFGAGDRGFEWSPMEDAADTAREAYAALWNYINGPEAWDLNPWVWVIGFRRITL